MINSLTPHAQNFLRLFFPHTCEGCGTNILHRNSILCPRCFAKLPETGFIQTANNLVEKKFYGQINIRAAGSMYYFTKKSLLQHLIKQLKYYNNTDVGYYFGKQLGIALANSQRFKDVDVIIPLPLNPRRERKRGYNQSAIIVEGISQEWNKPILTKVVQRAVFTETQTQKDRITRWQSMQNVFYVSDKDAITNKHVLLVDDIVTTGATLEACAEKILQVPGTKVYIATIAFTI